jgi:hypothetical protein
MSEQRRLATVALGVLAAAVLLVGLVYWQNVRGGQPDRLWFDSLVDVQEPSDEQVLEIAEWLSSRFLNGEAAEPPPDADSTPRIVFLTLSDGTSPGAVVQAGGEGLAEAAERALALAEARRAERDWKALKLDVVSRVGEPQRVGPRERFAFERGLDGLAFDARSGLAFLPEEVVVRTLVNSDSEMRAANIEKHLRRLGSALESEVDRLWSGGEARVRTFSTRAVYVDSEGAVPLYRGHPELRRAGTEDLLEAAISAGDYLRRAVKDNGEFIYSYLPKTDEDKDDYNMLRHAGTAYSMLEIYGETRDPAILEAAERALDFLRGRLVECRAGESWGSCVEEKGYVKLGGNGLAILAFAKHADVTGEHESLPLLTRLANWMLSVQEESGEFSTHKLQLTTGEVDDFVSEYYPGEALFALVRLYQLDGDPRWLDAAERGAAWLIEVRDGDLTDDELSHDHWLLYALNEIHRESPRELYLDHALRLARVISTSQNREPDFPDWRGSYYRPPRSTPTATRSEGLSAAWELANRAGHAEEAAEILEATRLGVDFQYQLQFRPESTLYLPDPERALGGFPRSLTNFEIRIDYVQHNLSSLLALRRILLADGVTG